ncbi:MAG: hypothetical protein IPI24_05350 [Ignavibacteria bacterium]|nr:hypothetical protein [Ignavibacteria bacterium]
MAAHCARYKVFAFLDESHRIKSGAGKQTARATLGLSHLPVSKLIMSGTPMPQSTNDLIPQFLFLYPEIPADTDTVVGLMRPKVACAPRRESLVSGIPRGNWCACPWPQCRASYISS